MSNNHLSIPEMILEVTVSGNILYNNGADVGEGNPHVCQGIENNFVKHYLHSFVC